MERDAIKWGSRLILTGSLNVSFWFVFTGIPFHFFVAGITFCLGGVLFLYDGNMPPRTKLGLIIVISMLSLVLLHSLAMYFVVVQSSVLFARDLYLISHTIVLASPVVFSWTMLTLSTQLSLDAVKKIWKNVLNITAGFYLLPAFLYIIFVIAYAFGFNGTFSFELGVNGEPNQANVIFYYLAHAAYLAPLGYLNYVFLQTATAEQMRAP